MTNTRVHTRGRGSNPASRRNLTGAKRDVYIYKFDGGQWVEIAGPMAGHVAYRKALKLGAGHVATTRPIYDPTPLPGEDWI